MDAGHKSKRLYIAYTTEELYKAVQAGIRRVCTKYGTEKAPTVADYRSGNARLFKAYGDRPFDEELNRALYKHTYCLTAGGR